MENLGALIRLPQELRDKTYEKQLLADEVATHPNENGFSRYKFDTAICRTSKCIRSEARKVLYEGNAFISITTNRLEIRDDYMKRFGISFYFGKRPQTLKSLLRFRVQFQEGASLMFSDFSMGFVSNPKLWPVESALAFNKFSVVALDLELFTHTLRCFDLSTTIYLPLITTHQANYELRGLQYWIRLNGVPRGQLQPLADQKQLLEPFKNLWGPSQRVQIEGQVDRAYAQKVGALTTRPDSNSYIRKWEPYKYACWLKYAADELFRASEWKNAAKR